MGEVMHAEISICLCIKKRSYIHSYLNGRLIGVNVPCFLSMASGVWARGEFLLWMGSLGDYVIYVFFKLF